MAVVATSATKTATTRQIRSVDFIIDLLASSDTTLSLPVGRFPWWQLSSKSLCASRAMDRRPFSTSLGDERFPTTFATETVGAWGRTQGKEAYCFGPEVATRLDSPHA